MPSTFRPYFAAVCLVAVVACKENRANNFNLEKTLLNRAQSNDMYVHPDKIPNWMRGFYDDFHPEQRQHWERSHEREPVDLHLSHDYYHPDDSEMIKYHLDSYEQSHDERGFMLIPPSHEEVIQVDPF